MRANEEGHFRLEMWDERTGRYLGAVEVKGLPPESVVQAVVVKGKED